MINLLIFIIALILLIEVVYCPRIDKTRMGDILLYYGKPGNRKWMKLN